MAEDINSVTIVGRLTKDAELQYTNSGYPLCKMSIAVNRKKKSGDQWIEEANFFDLSLWGRIGESLNTYLVKGQQIAVSGSLKQDRWEKDGVKRSKVSIDVRTIQLVGSKGERTERPQAAAGTDHPAKNVFQADFQDPAPEDDIPF